MCVSYELSTLKSEPKEAVATKKLSETLWACWKTNLRRETLQTWACWKTNLWRETLQSHLGLSTCLDTKEPQMDAGRVNQHPAGAVPHHNSTKEEEMLHEALLPYTTVAIALIVK